MERLTTNKEKSEMGMYELAHNSCYYKDGAARYRDFETDIDARELTRQLLKDYADGDDAFVDDDDFDEEMLELLMYGTSTTEGLIALFYRNMWAMADLRERLKEYEDADEQGLLLRLPCKVGDKVWRVFNVNGREPVISSFEFTLSYYENWEREFGKTIFTSKEAAIEAANIKYEYVEYELQSGDSVESIGKKHGQHTTLTCPWIDRFMEANHIVDKKTFDELFKPGNIVKVPIWREKDE